MNNRVRDNFSVNLYIDNASNVLMQGNTSRSSGNATYYRDGKPARSILMANEEWNPAYPERRLQNNRVLRNTIDRAFVGIAYGNFYQPGLGMPTTEIAFNAIQGSTDAILVIDPAVNTGSSVHDNTFVTNGSSVVSIQGSGVSVYNNVTTNTPVGGGLVSSGVYRITPAGATDKALDVSGVSTNDGSNVHIWSFGGGANQKWKALDVGGGWWEFEPTHAPGKRLDVSGAANANGANVHQWRSNGGTAQRWKLLVNGDGTFGLEPQCAPGKRLDVSGGGTNNGTNVQIWTGSSTNTNQKWRFAAP